MAQCVSCRLSSTTIMSGSIVRSRIYRSPCALILTQQLIYDVPDRIGHPCMVVNSIINRLDAQSIEASPSKRTMKLKCARVARNVSQ